MGLNDIEVGKTAILFFDLLNGYYHEADESTKARMKPMVDNATRLMKAGREAGIPIFYARGNHRPDGATTPLLLTDTDYAIKPWPGGVPVRSTTPPAVGGQSSSEVIPELDPRPDDYYIPKYRWSAFFQTYLDLALRVRGIDTVIISGGSTDVGIVATVFAGRDLDYHQIVVRDACSARDQQVNDMLMDSIFPRMGRVRTTDETLAMIKAAKAK